MASTEYLTKRLEGKKKEVEKLEKKLERILKAQATDWEVNPYYYSENDLKWTRKDLESARQAQAKLEEDLAKSIEKDNSRNVKVIVDFLEAWKAQVRDYYKDQFPKFLKARSEYWAESHELSEKRRYGQFHGMSKEELDSLRKEYEKLSRCFKERWSFMEVYVTGKEFETDRFERDIKNEADRKYDNIIERTNEIVGTIRDASGLEVGNKGELDGYVIGGRGTAHVHTIGAGGYNIQCYHFRVLVHEIRDKVN